MYPPKGAPALEAFCHETSVGIQDHFLKKRNMHYLMAFLYLAVVIASGIIVNDKLNEVALIEEAEAYQPVLNL